MTVELLTSLHAGRRRLPLSSGPRLALATCALVVNALQRSLPVSTALVAVALSLAVADRVEVSRLRPYLLALISGGVCVAAGWLAGARSSELALLAARIVTGLLWVAWAGVTSRWAEVRALFERVGLSGAADILESALAQGELLGSELRRGREAVVVRHAFRLHKLQTAALLLAGAFERALVRIDALDEARGMRSAAPLVTSPGCALEIAGLSVAGCCGPSRLLDVDLTLARGEWVALAGPSGSGKTTLLKTIAGLVQPQAGAIARFGRVMANGPLSERVDGRVALVFQDPNDQLLGATPVEDVTWGLRHRGVPRAAADARARATLDSLVIGELADRPIHELSFGERKRAAFAAALAVRPDLLLCDEPTMGLDPVAASRLVHALATAAGAGLTVLWATHDLAALPRAIDRIVLLSGGRVAFDGPLHDGLSPRRLEGAGLAVPHPGAVQR